MLVPCNYRALIKHKDVEEVTKGGIVLPEQVRDKEKLQVSVGVVVALGPMASQDTTAEVGDTVVYARHGGRFVKDPDTGIEYTVMNAEDILLVVVNEESKDD